MKRVFAILVAFLIFIFTFNTTACAKELTASAQAYVLYCVENETVVLSQNADVKMKPASTTKVMTTLLALEEVKKNDRRVQFNKEMIAEGSSMYLKAGDTVHLSDLAKGMMMASGNDAANAVALSLCDSIPDFAKLMNKKADKIGMENTNFVTPSGLDDENHYTTALDMAYLFAYALQNEDFAEITRSKSLDVNFLSPQKTVTYHNHNRLLSLYPHCIGGKTGFTKSAGRCLVSGAKKDGVTLVCVTFNAPDDWNDHIKMYDYGFNKLSAIDTENDDTFQVDVVGGEKDFLTLYCDDTAGAVVSSEYADDVKKTVITPSFLYAPVSSGDFVGVVRYTLDDKVLVSHPLYAQNNIDIKKKKSFFTFLNGIFS